ncbi:hypothetical protein ACFE04_005166 [Oxalis oulophora]
MVEQKVIDLSQVAKHNSKKDCWFVVNGKVLDVSSFMEEHPGGEEVLLESAGKDATKEFDEIGHSKEAQKSLVKYQVGVLRGSVNKVDEIKDDLAKEPKKKEMKAFVIKESVTPKYAAFIQFFVPLLVAGSYLAYRSFNREDLVI